MTEQSILRREERAIYTLRGLYRGYGYLPYKMSKFESYEYYIRNKDFLVSDRVITFNDTDGRLLALKPDVTLSIVRHGEDAPGCKQKLCYDERVYRVAAPSGRFRELMQAGLECIGDIDLYDVFETVALAAESLELLGEEFVLQVSHLGILSAVLEEAEGDEAFRRSAMGYIAQKNTHDLERLCAAAGVPAAVAAGLAGVARACGPRREVLERLAGVCTAPAARAALEELRELSALLDGTPYSGKIIFDLSVVNNMNYYNGILYRGFVDGISQSILVGGQYGKLLEKLGRGAGAVGFALYLDLLEQLPEEGSGYDVDVLLLYSEKDRKEAVAAAVAALRAQGKTVSAQRSVPDRLRFREKLVLGEEGTPC